MTPNQMLYNSLMQDDKAFLDKQISDFDPEQSKAFLKRIIAMSPVGIGTMKVVRNEENVIIDFECNLASAMLQQQMGFMSLVDRKLSELLPLMAPAPSMDDFIDVVNEGRTLHKEVAFSEHNGFRWLNIDVQKFEDGIMIVTEDITNSARTEEQIRHQTLLFTKIIESSPDVIEIVSFTSGKSTYINKMLLDQLNYPFEEIKKIEAGRGVPALIHPDDLSIYENFLNGIRAASNTDTIEAEIRFRAYDRSWKWYNMRAKVFERDALRMPLKFLAFLQDVTPQKLAEEEKRINQTLREVEKARTEFFNNVSHEFRTPLTLLLAPLQQIVAMQTFAKNDMEKVQMAYRNALRLQKLVNTLLDFARIESGRLDAIFQPTDISKFTAELASNFRPIIEQAGIKFNVRCAPVDEPVYINRDMYEKIVFNLLSNAFKYTSAGKIEVIIKDNKTHVKLKVRDTGSGIAEKYHEKIFERFARIETKKARTYEGTGIGLSFVRELVHYHRGSIAIESQPDKGAEFTVILYKGKSHLPQKNLFEFKNHGESRILTETYIEELKSWVATPKDFEYSKKKRRYGDMGGSSSRPLILVIDDNADMTVYLKRLLDDEYDVTVAANGRFAIEAIQSGRVPDLILSDIMMPEVDGYGLLQAMKSNERTKDIPIIFLTARAGDDSTLEGMRTGVDDYIVKPFSAKELMARIDARIQIARGQKVKQHALQELNEQLTRQVADQNDEVHRVTTALVEKDLELHSLNADMNTLTFVASHDLTEPLRKIQLYARFIKSHDILNLSQDGRYAFNRMYASAEQMSSLIHDVRIYTNLVDVREQISHVNLNKVFDQLKTIFGDELRDTNAVIAYQKLPVLSVNPEQILQLFHNIVSNSFKFRIPGQRAVISITAFQVPADQIRHAMVVPEREYICIEIKDNGIGFEQKYEQKIFQMFQRLHSKDEYPGNGIGLAISKRIAENHKGFITTESYPGQGASFYCYFPEALVVR